MIIFTPPPKATAIVVIFVRIQLCNYIIYSFCVAGPRPFVFVARCCVSDRCYLLFDPFSSTVDFFESCAMREIEDLSLFSYGFVFA